MMITVGRLIATLALFGYLTCSTISGRRGNDIHTTDLKRPKTDSINDDGDGLVRSSLDISENEVKSNRIKDLITPPNRIVAIGDLHGSYKRALRVFELANITDYRGNWVAESGTTVVQTGDVTDRKDDTIVLYMWLMKLKKQATDAGSKLKLLLGNHELMNLEENYKYVTEDDIASFGSKKNRKRAYSPQGWIGSFLRELDIMTQINGTVFVHGGITQDNFPYNIKDINRKNKMYMHKYTGKKLGERKLYESDHNSPLWYRGYMKEPESVICPKLKTTLDTLQAKRMVMGHSITNSRKIETRCDGRAIFIDVNIAGYKKPNNLAALEFTEGHVRALYENEIEELPYAQ